MIGNPEVKYTRFSASPSEDELIQNKDNFVTTQTGGNDPICLYQK